MGSPGATRGVGPSVLTFHPMHRRAFLHRSSLLAAGAVLTPEACAVSPQNRFPMGYQLFSVRDAMADDPLGTVRALLAMGFRHFEAYGYDAAADELYGLSPKRLKAELDDLDTRITSAHFGFADYLHKSADELRTYTDACLAAAEALDMRYLVWPVIRAEDRTAAGFRQLATQLNVIGAHVQGSGRRFAFHNNGGEFADLGDGARGYDIVLAETDAALVKLELDMYWLAHESALTPAELIARQPGRFHLWHVKDMEAGTKAYTELGNGTIDYKRLLPEPEASGLEYLYLEQGGNFAEGSMASAATNAGYWKEQLARRVR